MRGTLIIIGALVVLTGFVWILQGIKVLPGSFVTGQIRWTYAGIVAAMIGGEVLWITVHPRGGN